MYFTAAFHNIFTRQLRLSLQKSWKLKDDHCTNARPSTSSHLENFNHVSMAPCVQCSSVTVSQRLEACVSERADFGSTWKIWVCQVAVSFFRRPTALLKFGMGTFAARRVQSTVPLTLCRNAGGNWIVFSYPSVLLCLLSVKLVNFFVQFNVQRQLSRMFFDFPISVRLWLWSCQNTNKLCLFEWSDMSTSCSTNDVSLGRGYLLK